MTNYEDRFNTKTAVSNILDSKDRKLRLKQIDVAEAVYASLQRTGKIYNCGGAAAWVRPVKAAAARELGMAVSPHLVDRLVYAQGR